MTMTAVTATDPRDETPEEVRLYGVLVLAVDYRRLKVIADQLIGVTFVDTNKSAARRKAVQLAQSVLTQMRTWSKEN